MFIPSFSTCYFIGFAISLVLLNIRFLLLFVKILTHEIKNRIQTFLRVMLSITFKSHIVLTKNSFKRSGLTTESFPRHISPMSFAHAITILPSVPKGFFHSLSTNGLYLRSKKYLVSS